MIAKQVQYGIDIVALSNWIMQHNTMWLTIQNRIERSEAVKYIHRHVKPHKELVRTLVWLAIRPYISVTLCEQAAFKVDPSTLTRLFAMGILQHVHESYQPAYLKEIGENEMIYTFTSVGAVMCQEASDVFSTTFEAHTRAGNTVMPGFDWQRRPEDSLNWCLLFFYTEDSGDVLQESNWYAVQQVVSSDLEEHSADFFEETLEYGGEARQLGYSVRVWSRYDNCQSHAYRVLSRLFKQCRKRETLDPAAFEELWRDSFENRVLDWLNYAAQIDAETVKPHMDRIYAYANNVLRVRRGPTIDDAYGFSGKSIGRIMKVFDLGDSK